MVLEIFFDNKISIIFSLRNCFRKNIYQECWCFYKSFISGSCCSPLYSLDSAENYYIRYLFCRESFYLDFYFVTHGSPFVIRFFVVYAIVFCCIIITFFRICIIILVFLKYYCGWCISTTDNGTFYGCFLF